MDLEKYRRDYLTELQASEPRRSVSPETVASYAAGDERDPGTLCEMLRALPLRPDALPETVAALLAVLRDETADPQVRLAALRQLGAAEFQPVPFAPFRADYIEALRGLAVSPHKELRAAALDRLTLLNDPEAQRLLRESLEKSRKPLVPAAKAIQLLARDDHAAALPIVRDLAANAKGRTREQALRALAGDPRSAGLFEGIVGDKAERPALRRIAAANLKNAAPARFAKLARQIALDTSEEDAFRAATVSAIAHSGEVASRLQSATFTKALKAAGLKTTSRALKSSIRRFDKFGSGSSG